MFCSHSVGFSDQDLLALALKRLDGGRLIFIIIILLLCFSMRFLLVSGIIPLFMQTTDEIPERVSHGFMHKVYASCSTCSGGVTFFSSYSCKKPGNSSYTGLEGPVHIWRES